MIKKGVIKMNLGFFGESQERDGRLREIETRLAEIGRETETRGAELTHEDLTAFNTEVTTLNEERATLNAVAEQRAALQTAIASGTAGIIVRDLAQQPPGGGNTQRNAPTDRHDTPEYRSAFMNYVCRGVPIPAEIRGEPTPAEIRAAEVTGVADVGAVIPTSTLQEIIRELDSYGAIYAKVRKLNIHGGVRVPILTLKPVAVWVGEGASDDQKIAADQYVSFSYYGLECKIAQTLLASVVTYEMFQREFVTLSTEAIVRELEKCIFNGTGTGQMLGITKDGRVPEANVITLSQADFRSWEGWTKNVLAKRKKAYRTGIFAMAQGTFEGYINGMVDETGQPIGRVNWGIDGAETYRFAGIPVETVEDDVIIGYDEAAVGDIVAVFFNPSSYAINSNMALMVVQWTDHDTNQKKIKAILICDGKLLDANGVLIIKKGA